MSKTAGSKVKCLTCMAIIQSMHRHDFTKCNCALSSSTVIYVDGGSDYLKMGIGAEASYRILNDNEEE